MELFTNADVITKLMSTASFAEKCDLNLIYHAAR